MRKFLLGLSLLSLGLTTSCADFFESDSTYSINAEEEHLKTATDTLYSVAGILNKLQAIGDRTVLLGEMRGDLVSVTQSTAADLRKVAMFDIDDDNIYNEPRDYYAIINNCNYFIAHADTTLKNHRNEYLFMREYAAVKAIRAWTYLQLAITYGRVPFVLEPIMTEEEAQRDYPMYDIQQVCDYFVHEDGLQRLVDKEYPAYNDIRLLPSKLFFPPLYVVLGDLNLWGGYYWDAAVCYHNYISTRNGSNSAYPIYANHVAWSGDDYIPKSNISWSNYTGVMFASEAYTSTSELVFMIPTDSLKSEANYSRLRYIFTSSAENDYEVSAVPSTYLKDLSASQDYWQYDIRTKSFSKAPKGLGKLADGDLRLYATVYLGDDVVINGETKKNYVENYKYTTRNIHLCRRAQVYLRLAEAVNRAGYPLYAFKILETGVDSEVLRDSICPAYPDDSLKLVTNLDFASGKYLVSDPMSTKGELMNTIGIHRRGCGYPMGDTLYVMPYNKEIAAGPDSAATQLAWQIEKVEDMIIDEMALELAFEGSRYYDLMRVALHRNDPAYLDRKVKARNGEGNDSGISVDLSDMHNWFLHWQGKIGY